MNKALQHYFPNSIEIGEGVALGNSPFSSVCTVEYYDGPTTGLVFFDHLEAVATFKKIWWDGSQDNRLFEMHLVKFEKLAEPWPLLFDLVTRARADRWRSTPTAEDRESVCQLADLAPRLHAVGVFVFARDIEGPLFILPSRYSD